MFVDLDLLQCEINPWAIDDKNDIYCIDAKLNVDDNAKFRQQELVDMQKNSLGSEENDIYEKEVNIKCDFNSKAVNAGLNYISLDGNIGCMVNGAGLAMATMDLIKLNGGEPANFLDVGGGANVD
jgi:succinyl-CoA synthetase beta subunit